MKKVGKKKRKVTKLVMLFFPEKTRKVGCTNIIIGAKLAVAPVARATPLFLPRPEIIYINVLHFSAPPRTYLVSATPLFRPLWRH